MLDRVRNAFARAIRFAARIGRAWRYYTKLSYSWRLSWAKAATGGTLDEHADIRHAGTR